jgi:hypothetical protein
VSALSSRSVWVAFSLGRWALLQIRHDSREAGSLHRGEEAVACLIAWFALGHDGFFKSSGENGARSARYCDDSTQPMACPSTTSVCIKLTTFPAGWLPWPCGTTRRPGTFPFGAPCFHAESAHASIGVPHERFLYHRRHRCRPLCRRLPRAARLNKNSDGICEIMNSSREF